MRILVAEDDPISRKLLEVHLERAGYSVDPVRDGGQAWEALHAEGAPRLAVLDWMMPGMDGVEICRRIRAERRSSYVYLVLLTARSRKQDRDEGFRAGADDYLTKPFDVQDLRARVMVGKRIIELQSALEAKVAELSGALRHVKKLQGLLPICMHCKKIRDDRSTWHRLEAYIEQHTEVAFTHSLCQDCRAVHYPELAEARDL